MVLSIRESKKSLVAGTGFLLFLMYYLIVWCSGIESIKGLTIGLFFSRVMLQQITTGFYEELNFRFLVMEGYYYGVQSIKNKLLYSFLSSLLFGAVHVVYGWSVSGFLITGVIGFAFAVMYLKSRNIVFSMILHFAYDVFANLTNYVEWNNSAMFVTMNSAADVMLIIMFGVSFVLLLADEKDENNRGG